MFLREIPNILSISRFKQFVVDIGPIIYYSHAIEPKWFFSTVP